MSGQRVDAAWRLLNRAAGRLGAMVVQRRLSKVHLKQAIENVEEALTILRKVKDE